MSDRNNVLWVSPDTRQRVNIRKAKSGAKTQDAVIQDALDALETDSIVKRWLDGDWPVTFDAKTTDEDARKHAAFTLNCKPEDIEILRHNIVLCRYNPKEVTE